MEDKENADFLGSIIDAMDSTFDSMNPGTVENNSNGILEDSVKDDNSSITPRVQHVGNVQPNMPAAQPTAQPQPLDQLAVALTALATNIKDAQDKQNVILNRMVTNMSPEPKPQYKGKGKGTGKSSEKKAGKATETTCSQQEQTSRKRKERDVEDNGAQGPASQKVRHRNDDYDINDRHSDLDYNSEMEDSDYEYEIEFEDEADTICNNIDKLLKENPLHPVEGKQAKQTTKDTAQAGPSGLATRDQTLEECVLDEHLRGLAQSWVNDDDIGPEVSEQLAKVLNNMLTKKLSADKLKNMIEENAPPSNVELLQPPRVTEIVWNTLNENAKSTDVKVKKIQLRITRGMTIIARLIDVLLSCKRDGTAPDINQCLDKALHAFAMLSSGNLELSLRRREQMRGDLNPRFARLCYPSTPVTTDLFGGEVKNLVEDIRKSHQLGAHLSRNQRGRGRGGYNGNRGRGRGGYNNSGGYGNRGGRRGGYQGNNQNRSYPKNSKRGVNKSQNQPQ